MNWVKSKPLFLKGSSSLTMNAFVYQARIYLRMGAVTDIAILGKDEHLLTIVKPGISIDDAKKLAKEKLMFLLKKDADRISAEMKSLRGKKNAKD